MTVDYDIGTPVNGLCSNYDGDEDNDYVLKDGTDMKNNKSRYRLISDDPRLANSLG